MFENCPFVENKQCAMCGYDYKKILRCGYARPENVIERMSLCPIQKDIPFEKRDKKYRRNL